MDENPTCNLCRGSLAQEANVMEQLLNDLFAIPAIAPIAFTGGIVLYLTELLKVCDRVAVMARGRLREVRPVADWTEESVMSVAVAGEAT